MPVSMGNQSNKNEEVGLGWDNPPQLGDSLAIEAS